MEALFGVTEGDRLMIADRSQIQQQLNGGVIRCDRRGQIDDRRSIADSATTQGIISCILSDFEREK